MQRLARTRANQAESKCSRMVLAIFRAEAWLVASRCVCSCVLCSRFTPAWLTSTRFVVSCRMRAWVSNSSKDCGERKSAGVGCRAKCAATTGSTEWGAACGSGNVLGCLCSTFSRPQCLKQLEVGTVLFLYDHILDGPAPTLAMTKDRDLPPSTKSGRQAAREHLCDAFASVPFHCCANRMSFSLHRCAFLATYASWQR